MDRILTGYKYKDGHILIDSRNKNRVDQSTGERVEPTYFVVRECKPNRSTAQNRLYWALLSDFEETDNNEHAGHTLDDWHEFFKGEYLSRIYERDNHEYAEMIETIREVWRKGMRHEAELLRAHVIRETTTTQATTAQFAEYLKLIENWAAVNSIRLPSRENFALENH